MEKEIGSNFCEEISICSRRVDDKNGRLFFDSARSALRYLLDCVGQQIKTVMLPSYDCGSVFEVFAERNYEMVFYPINQYLELCTDEFRKLLEEKKPQMVLVQSYFGFDTLKKDREYLDSLRKEGVTIVEDITHSLFAERRTICADYEFGSIRKWCAVPDGGVLVGKKALLQEQKHSLRENTEFVSRRLEAQRKKRNFFFDHSEGSEKEAFIRLFDESEAILDCQKQYYSMSEYTRTRIGTVFREKVVRQRQENYRILKDELAHIHGLEIIFADCKDYTTPLYFPVYVEKEKRDGLRAYAQKRNVFLPIIWPMPFYLKDRPQLDAWGIYSKILAIPCDQRYMKEDMKFIAEIIAEYMM